MREILKRQASGNWRRESSYVPHWLLHSCSAHFEGKIQWFVSLLLYTSVPEFLKTWGFLANFENIYPFVFFIKWLFTLPAVLFFLEERGGGSAEPRTRLDFLLLLQIMAVCFLEQLSWKSAVLLAQGRGTFEVVSVVFFIIIFKHDRGWRLQSSIVLLLLSWRSKKMFLKRKMFNKNSLLPTRGK